MRKVKFSFKNIKNILNFVEESKLEDEMINIYQFNYELREHKIGLTITETLGMYGYIFNDFGDEYHIQNTGIEEHKIEIKDITFEEQCIVILSYTDEELYFLEGDIIEFLNLEGSKGIHMLNEKEFTVIEVIGDDKIRVNCNTSKYSYILDNAKISLKKRGEIKTYLPLSESICQQYCTEYLGFTKHALIAKILYTFRDLHGKIDSENSEAPQIMLDLVNNEYIDEFIKAYKDLHREEYEKHFEEEINLQMFEKLVRCVDTEIVTITSIFGGLAAVEALKLTGKYTPIDQWYAYNMTHYLPDSINQECTDLRYSDNIQCFGSDTQKALNQLNIFLPGVGAIGWEVLKCLACLGIGIKSKSPDTPSGKITITDFDSLEISNLNRQFLFTDGDRGKRKSRTAKAKILKINKDLNIDSYRKKLDINRYESWFNFKFWNSLDIVINGLDNIEGRVYLDRKWVEHEIPFLESGTEGPMGHSSIIMPFKTNTYEDFTTINK